MHNSKFIFAVVMFVGAVMAERCQVNVAPARQCGECDLTTFAYEVEMPSKATVTTADGRVPIQRCREYVTPTGTRTQCVSIDPAVMVARSHGGYVAHEPTPPGYTACNGKTNHEITKPTTDEQLQIDELIYQVDESTIWNFFSSIINAVTDAIHSIFARPAKTLLSFHRYLLNVEVNGGDAHFRIQSASKTYSHVVVRVGKVVTTTDIREAFVKSCNCGQTVHLN